MQVIVIFEEIKWMKPLLVWVQIATGTLDSYM
jgi:hypothetical protein